jgi:hypothetical protein
MSGGLGRREPTDWVHVERYGLVGPLGVTPVTVEDSLPLPYALRIAYDQGQEGACVGFGWSWAMSILNSLHGFTTVTAKYDPRWLYQQAQAADEWPETPPEEGTSVRAAGDVLRLQGHVRIVRNKEQPVNPAEGILANRWATSVDEMRGCISRGVPVVIGVNWYSNFFTPELVGREYWIGRGIMGPGNLGRVEGGHCVCVYGASDKRQAFRIVNNWGKDWPLVWIPYDVMVRLIREDGEIAVIVDK